MSELKTVKSCTDSMEAEIVKGLLESHGVPVVIIGGDGSKGYMPIYQHKMFSDEGSHVLAVSGQDYEKALDILNAEPVWDENQAEPPPVGD